MSSSPEPSASPPNRSLSPVPVNNSTAALSAAQALLGMPDGKMERRPSIQFAPAREASRDRRPKGDRPRRRISSPPPPPVFQPRVSFDTFGQAVDFIDENSFTLVTKHKDYEYTKRSRTFLCGCDDNDYSDYALKWLIDELVDDGDEIVCLRVVEKDDTIAGERSVEKGRYRTQAEDLMKKIQKKNHENKAINLVLEFSVGKVNKVIDEMINLYEPAILVVGTRGKSLGGFQGLLPGSVSKYCLQHSPVPVIVVRPSSKRDKARNKRALDPNRHSYKDLLEKSGPLLDADGHIFSPEDSRQASEDEAAAVAAAIGYKPRRLKGSSPLVKTQSASSEVSAGGAYFDDMRSPGIVMKSPNLRDLDSPNFTSDESSTDDDEDGDGVMLKDKDEHDDAGPEIPGGVATNVMDTALGAILNKSKRRTPSKSPARGRGLSKSPARIPVQNPPAQLREAAPTAVETPTADEEAKPAVKEVPPETMTEQALPLELVTEKSGTVEDVNTDKEANKAPKEPAAS